MKYRTSRFDDPAACANALATIFMTYVRTAAANDREFATAVLEATRPQCLALVASRLSEGDLRAMTGIFDLARAAVVPEDQAQ